MKDLDRRSKYLYNLEENLHRSGANQTEKDAVRSDIVDYDAELNKLSDKIEAINKRIVNVNNGGNDDVSANTVDSNTDSTESMS
jgi:hypothetical protein